MLKDKILKRTNDLLLKFSIQDIKIHELKVYLNKNIIAIGINNKMVIVTVIVIVVVFVVVILYIL
jgi:hypothetical protein